MKRSEMVLLMYALRRTLHQGSLERDWLEDIEKYVHSLRALSMEDADYLIERQAIKIQELKTEVQCLKDDLNWEREAKLAWRAKHKELFQTTKKVESILSEIEKHPIILKNNFLEDIYNNAIALKNEIDDLVDSKS